jgi:hypothetical protein
MKIVGCDLHAKQQAIAMVDTETTDIATGAGCQTKLSADLS